MFPNPIRPNIFPLNGSIDSFVDEEDDGVSFEEKMKDYTNTLNIMNKESSDLDQKITSSLKKIGF